MTNKEYYFGYDLDNVQAVESYVKANYKEDTDFQVFVGYGDDVMNALEVYNDEINKDKKFLELVSNCVGEGDYEEEDEDEDDYEEEEVVHEEAIYEEEEEDERESDWMAGRLGY